MGKGWLASPGWSWMRTQRSRWQQTSVLGSNIGLYRPHWARLCKAKPWICESSRRKKCWDIYKSSQPLGLLSGLCAASSGNANYILVTRLPHFLLPWRRISVTREWVKMQACQEYELLQSDPNSVKQRVGCLCFRKWDISSPLGFQESKPFFFWREEETALWFRF